MHQSRDVGAQGSNTAKPWLWPRWLHFCHSYQRRKLLSQVHSAYVRRHE